MTIPRESIEGRDLRIAETGIKVGGPLRRVLLEFLDGPLTGATTLKVRAFAVVLTDVQLGPSSPLFGDDQLAYRLFRHPKDLTHPCVRPLRMVPLTYNFALIYSTYPKASPVSFFFPVLLYELSLALFLT